MKKIFLLIAIGLLFSFSDSYSQPRPPRPPLPPHPHAKHPTFKKKKVYKKSYPGKGRYYKGKSAKSRTAYYRSPRRAPAPPHLQRPPAPPRPPLPPLPPRP